MSRKDIRDVARSRGHGPGPVTEAAFVSTAHTAADIEQTIKACHEAFKRI